MLRLCRVQPSWMSFVEKFLPAQNKFVKLILFLFDFSGLHRWHGREQLHGHHLPRQQVQLSEGRPQRKPQVHRQEQAL